MTEELADSGLFGRIAVTHMHSSRALEAGELERVFRKHMSCDFEVYEDVPAAFLNLLEKRCGTERIYIAGSLYLVGEIKELLSHDKFRRRIEEVSSQP